MSDPEFLGWYQGENLLWAEAGGFRLVVHLPSMAGLIRFAVIRPGRRTGLPDMLVGSGTEDDVGTAKAAAERMAGRLAAIHFGPKRRSGRQAHEYR